MTQSQTSGRALRQFIACLAIVGVCAALAAMIQSSGGRVNVSHFTLPTQNGQHLAATLFKPISATAENPAPFIVVIPGFQRSKEALANIAIELSRRGFVVASIDPYAQGHSSSSMSTRAATEEGYGLFALVNYAATTHTLNYIDKKRIGATGHSAGGNAAIRGASYFGREAKRLGKPSKLHSVFISGYVLTLRDSVLRHVRSNIGVSYALYDEGAFRNALKSGDMRKAPEALRVINSAQAGEQSAVSEVVPGQWYGEASTRSRRIVHNEALLHPFQPYNGEATANQIAYFETVFNHQSGLTHTDQIWQWKELFGLLSLIFSLVCIVPLGQLLLQTAPFRSLVHPIPSAPASPKGRGQLVFWGLFISGAAIACVSFIPMVEVSKQLFSAASSRQQTWFFPQRMNNAVMLWAFFNGLVGLILFALSYHFYGRKHGANPDLWGIKTNRQELQKTFALAMIIFASYYLLLFCIDYFFLVDYRFWFMGVRVFQPVMLLVLLMYAPFFWVFFCANSLRINAAMRFEGQPEWRSMLLGGFANSLGLLLIIFIQYSVFAGTGTVYWTHNWLYINLLFGIVPMMFVLPYFNRYFFRLTGRIYLGPTVTCLIFIMILMTNTVCYIPLNELAATGGNP